MKNRFFFDGEMAAGQLIALNPEETHHARVLRVRDDEEVEVFNGRGSAFGGVYQRPDVVRLKGPIASRESPREVTLAMSIIQLDKFELVLQKATELGVAAIIPLVAERCEVRPERYRGKHDRWKKIIFEAVKQSGRSNTPRLEEPAPFEEVVKRDGLRVIYDADTKTTQTTEQRSNPATLFIGPEGGFSDDELRLARETGCTFATLGERRLRAETAAVVAIALAAIE